MSEESEAPTKKQKWYTQSFKQEWLNIPELQTWLKQDDNDPNSGYCECCNISLKNYNKSMLIKHSNSVKHKQNITLAEISVDITQFMEREPSKESEEVLKSELIGKQDNTWHMPIIIEKLESPAKKQKLYTQSFKQEWLNDPEWQTWLKQIDNDPSSGYCECCNLLLKNINKSKVIKHSHSVKHKRNITATRVSADITDFLETELSKESKVAKNKLIRKQDKCHVPILSDKSEPPAKKLKYTQSFKQGWLNVPELQTWLKRDNNDPNSSYCDCCNISLKNYNKSMLFKHSNTVKHKQNITATRGSADITQFMEREPFKESEEVGRSELIRKQNNKCHVQKTCARKSHNNDSRGRNGRIQFEFNAEEECHTFAGGSVYPNTEGKASGHNLQWTKAMISRPAPDWDATAVIHGQFKQLKLSDYRGKYVVFFFYPLDFTFVCPTEILAFNNRLKEFRALNTEVIACSVDSHFTHLAWTKAPRKEGGLGKLDIPLVSDLTHAIAKDYGVYLEDQGVALRGLFIIDDKGILRQITMNDLPVGRSVDETLRLVQAFQFTDMHGEVCPAGWKPGDATIIPTPEESRKYFKAAHEEN